MAVSQLRRCSMQRCWAVQSSLQARGTGMAGDGGGRGTVAGPATESSCLHAQRRAQPSCLQWPSGGSSNALHGPNVVGRQLQSAAGSAASMEAGTTQSGLAPPKLLTCTFRLHPGWGALPTLGNLMAQLRHLVTEGGGTYPACNLGAVSNIATTAEVIAQG